tara:strand:- start:341 stop:1225 length:885 start_codon:yes stop_codon:yes gene_type:complete
MIFENIKLIKNLFGQLSLSKYVSEYNIAPLVGVDLSVYGEVEKKVVRDPSHNVTLNLTESFSPELDDLGRLHWLVNTRHVTTILEFGLGKSTIVFNDALSKNKLRDQNLIQDNLRRNNLYECHSIDNYEQWIDEVKSKHSLDRVTYHKSELTMGEFQGRVCTYYDPIPNLCPDFIYLDGPDQFSPVGSVRGITTNHKDRMPMSADILSIEHFLAPGTLIVTDGRTANARFLKTNLQRDWYYCHDQKADQHYFELVEEPLGIYNKRQIDFCLGASYFDRLSEMKKAKAIYTGVQK